MGISEYCVFDPGIVRGLAYYTGIVFEVHDIQGDLRAICGGGRYDNLLRDFGGPAVSATGMGMGDCVLEILLREKGLLDKNISSRSLDYYVVPIAGELLDEAVKLTAGLRTKGFKAAFSYKAAGLSKLLKNASEQNAKYCVIIGDEFKAGNIAVKDMATGQQQTISVEQFMR
jgi:histidyl-tRNA synthetase